MKAKGLFVFKLKLLYQFALYNNLEWDNIQESSGSSIFVMSVEDIRKRILRNRVLARSY